MRKLVLLILLMVSSSVLFAQDFKFSKSALDEVLLTTTNHEITLQNILNKYKGKTVLVDVWASWCKDCLAGLPKVKKLQSEFKGDVVYLFLSLDKEVSSWNKGIKKYDVKGEHYFIKEGWKGALGNSIKLNWIPRYMVINKSGNVVLFKAISADDKSLVKAIKTDI